MSAGMADLFAVFRDSHGLLVDGALTPDRIYLDPHWGSNWRYHQLAEFWKNAPPLFPGDSGTAWKVEPPSDGIQRLTAKGAPSLSWCRRIASCTLHFVFHLAEQLLDIINGQMLEQFIHCMADSVFQRKEFIENLSVFERKRIVTVVCANEATFTTEGDDEEKVVKPLLCNWSLITNSDSSSVFAKVLVNLARVRASFTDPIDGRFEAECVTEWIKGLQSLLGEMPHPKTLARLKESGSFKPRFTVTWVRRMIDVPDFGSPEVPQPEQYKIARRDLAVTLTSAPCFVSNRAWRMR
jgi:hypothetical protein